MTYPSQVGGVQSPVIEEIQLMSGHFLLLFLILVSVYVSRIPPSISDKMKDMKYQLLGFILIIIITMYYGYVHGILAALAFTLLVSHALRNPNEVLGFQNYVPSSLLNDNTSTVFVEQNQRWFGEKVLGENPYIIREKGVNTSAIQDLSERNMGTNSSNVSR
jgi:hypothetical protein